MGGSPLEQQTFRFRFWHAAHATLVIFPRALQCVGVLTGNVGEPCDGEDSGFCSSGLMARGGIF